MVEEVAVAKLVVGSVGGELVTSMVEFSWASVTADSSYDGGGKIEASDENAASSSPAAREVFGMAEAPLRVPLLESVDPGGSCVGMRGEIGSPRRRFMGGKR